MGQDRMLTLNAATKGKILCWDCDPGAGYGWEATERQKASWVKSREPGALPAPGNGYDIKGLCPACSGTGRAPVPFTEVWGL